MLGKLPVPLLAPASVILTATISLAFIAFFSDDTGKQGLETQARSQTMYTRESLPPFLALQETITFREVSTREGSSQHPWRLHEGHGQS